MAVIRTKDPQTLPCPCHAMPCAAYHTAATNESEARQPARQGLGGKGLVEACMILPTLRYLGVPRMALQREDGVFAVR